MQQQTEPIQANLREIEAQIRRAAEAAGRSPEEVRLVAVSKTKPVEAVRAALAAGQRVFGENKVQELVPKAEALPEAEWHLVGHLQRNKVKYIAPFVAMIHGLDSVKLLEEIEKQGAKAGRVLNCLIQVNISGEEQKSGATPEEAREILKHAPECPHVAVRGLMGISEETDDRARIRLQFRSLRELRDALRAEYQAPNIRLDELSMGMSGDFDLAIAEGATLVRVGSAIFGSR